MATDISIALEELLDKTGADVDFLREAVRTLVQELMEIEVTRQIGAARHERTLERKTHRNGYRHRSWDTRGHHHLHIPKLRRGSYFPSWLEPRRRAEGVLAVVQDLHPRCEHAQGGRTGQALGMTGISRASIQALCRSWTRWSKHSATVP